MFSLLVARVAGVIVGAMLLARHPREVYKGFAAEAARLGQVRRRVTSFDSRVTTLFSRSGFPSLRYVCRFACLFYLSRPFRDDVMHEMFAFCSFFSPAATIFENTKWVCQENFHCAILRIVRPLTAPQSPFVICQKEKKEEKKNELLGREYVHRNIGQRKKSIEK